MITSPGTFCSSRPGASSLAATFSLALRCTNQCSPSTTQSPCRHIARAASMTSLFASSSVVTLVFILYSDCTRHSSSTRFCLDTLWQGPNQRFRFHRHTEASRSRRKWAECRTLNRKATDQPHNFAILTRPNQNDRCAFTGLSCEKQITIFRSRSTINLLNYGKNSIQLFRIACAKSLPASPKMERAASHLKQACQLLPRHSAQPAQLHDCRTNGGPLLRCEPTIRTANKFK